MNSNKAKDKKGATMKLYKEIAIALALTAVVLPLAAQSAGTVTIGNEQRLRMPFVLSPMQSLNGDLTVQPDASVIAWNFEDASAPLADAYGRGSKLLASGTPVVVSDSERGNVLSLDGETYMYGPGANASFTGLPAGGTNLPYTFAFWVKPDANCDKQACVLSWGTTADRKMALLRFREYNTNTLLFSIWGASYEIPAPTVRDGGWHHIAVSYNGAKGFDIYYDRVKKTTLAISGDYTPPNQNLYIGCASPSYKTYLGSGYTGRFTGRLDDFVIVNYAMTSAEIAALTDAGVPKVGAEVALDGSGSIFVPDGTTTSLGALSGKGVLGGVEGSGATFVVGEGVAETKSSVYSAMIRGDASSPASLVKRGADYTQVLSGVAENVASVSVEAGDLTVRRPLARKGLICRYPFDDTGDAGFDAGPAGVALEATNDESKPLSFVEDGVSGRALHFGGASFLSSATAHLPSRFPSGNGSYTVSVWIRPTTAACTGKVPIFRFGAWSDYQLGQLRFESDRQLIFTTYGWQVGPVLGTAVDDGKWHHVAVTYDGDQNKVGMYFDGVLGNSYTGPSGGFKLDGRMPLYIGYNFNQQKFYSGDMDEFMMFDYAWSAEEVKDEFDRKAAETVAAETLLPTPVAHWTFDDAGNIGADSSGNSLDLTVKDGTVESTSDAFTCGGAARFADGVYMTLEGYSPLLPKGTKPFTVICRYKADLSMADIPGVVSIGGAATAANVTSGNIIKFGPGQGTALAARFVAGAIYSAPATTGRSADGTGRQRWVTAAAVYSPYTGGSTNVYCFYMDGVPVADKVKGPDMNIVDERLDIGGDPYPDGSRHGQFSGLVDDVQIFDRALSAGEIDLITRRLAAGAGKSEAETPSVLPGTASASVADGAMLNISSTETLASISGAGTVNISPLATLTVRSLSGFTGRLTGYGSVIVEKGATLDREHVSVAETLNLNAICKGLMIIFK